MGGKDDRWPDDLLAARLVLAQDRPRRDPGCPDGGDWLAGVGMLEMNLPAWRSILRMTALPI